MANGVPGLLHTIADITNKIALAVADALLIYNKFQAPSWGIFETVSVVTPPLLPENVYQLAIIPDSILSVDYDREWAIASYPQERGAFQNYNKIQLPFENRVQITKGGTITEKQLFINTLEAMAASLNLFDIVTPEQTFFNVNIYKISLSRYADSGASLLTYDVSFQEIRTSAVAKFSDTVDKNAADPVSDGTVQTTPIAPQTPFAELTPI